MLEKTVKDISSVKIPVAAIEDNGMVRMGTFTPPFPRSSYLPQTAAPDKRKVEGALAFPQPRTR